VGCDNGGDDDEGSEGGGGGGGGPGAGGGDQQDFWAAVDAARDQNDAFGQRSGSEFGERGRGWSAAGRRASNFCLG
jgi:hypothetical protein